MTKWMMKQGVLLFLACFASSVALAQSVVSEAEVPAPETPVVGYDHGFFIQGSDQNFKLVINGKLRPKYQFSHDPQRQADGGNLNANTFSIRNASIGFKVITYKTLTLDFSFTHATNSKSFSGVNVGGVTLTYAPMPEFSVQAGMVGLPLDFGSGGVMTDGPITATQTDGTEKLTIARNSFGAPDGLGVSFSGDINKFFYTANLVNRSEDNYNFNKNLEFSFGTQVGVNVLGDARGNASDFGFSEKPQLTLSAGALFEAGNTDDLGTPADPSDDATINHVVQASSGVTFKYMGFAWRTEGYLKTINVANPGAAVDLAGTKTDLGYYTTLAYFFVPKKLEGVLMGSQIIREGVANNSHELGAGLNWYIKGTNLYLQTSYYLKKAYDRLAGQSYQTSHVLETILTAKF